MRAREIKKPSSLSRLGDRSRSPSFVRRARLATRGCKCPARPVGGEGQASSKHVTARSLRRLPEAGTAGVAALPTAGKGDAQSPRRSRGPRTRDPVLELTRRTRGAARRSRSDNWQTAAGLARLHRILPDTFGAPRAGLVRSTRLRCLQWKQRKRGKQRFAQLKRQGTGKDGAAQTAGSPHDPWRISRSSALSFAFPAAFFKTLGLPSFTTGERHNPTGPPCTFPYVWSCHRDGPRGPNLCVDCRLPGPAKPAVAFSPSYCASTQFGTVSPVIRPK